MADKKFNQCAAKTPDVDWRPVCCATEEHFWWTIPPCSDIISHWLFFLLAALLIIVYSCKAEVCNLRSAVLIHYNISGFDVPMHDFSSMQKQQSTSYLIHDEFFLLIGAHLCSYQC
jgi:hypothetical protein